MLLATGSVVMVSSRQAQYTRDRKEYVQPTTKRSDEIGYDIEAGSKGRKLVWVPCGLTWQMLPCYGGVARHFTATRNGLNFAPNKSSRPSDHQDIAV